MTRLAALMTAVLLLAACSFGSTGAGPSPTPAPQPSRGCGQAVLSSGAPAGCGEVLTEAQLRLVLLDQLGPRWFCDPDDYPVAVQDEMTRMRERWNDLLGDADAYAAIAAHEGLPSDPKQLSDEQRLAVYRMWKVLNSIQLDPIGNARYRFDYLAQPVAGATDGTRTAGTIDDHGAMTVEQQAAAGEPPCPICLSVGTSIDTPDGPIAVERLRLGDPVWTLDADGRRIAGMVIALGSTQAPAGHQVVRLKLEDGRTVTASPGHPLADGRPLGEIRVGNVVDGSRVVGADLIPYTGDETFDLVASGPTGAYLAGGIPLGSTIR
jgi:Hint domain-containing protein